MEKRPDRRRVLQSGKLVFGDGLISMDCAIVNSSATGACVRLSAQEILPKELWFLHLTERRAYKATVIWRRHPRIGLDLEAVADFDHSEDPNVRYLRRLLRETQPRTGVAPDDGF